MDLETKHRGTTNKQLKGVVRPASRTADRKPAGSAVSRTSNNVNKALIRNKEIVISSTADKGAVQTVPSKPEKVPKIGAFPPRGRLPKIETTNIPRAQSPAIARIKANEIKGQGSSKNIPKDFEIDRASGRILTTKRSHLPKIETKKSNGDISSSGKQGVLESDLNVVDLEKDLADTDSNKIPTKKSSRKNSKRKKDSKVTCLKWST